MEQYTHNDEVMNHHLSSNHSKGDDLQFATKLLSYNDIATKLLNEKLLLTALELHAELCEAGRELPILRDYFSNPNNFENHSSSSIKPEPYYNVPSLPRSSSQATLDSLDMTRYSEDGGGMDERVAVLEFELRKAKENITALRANLTVALESDEQINDEQLLDDQPIKPHELRALNFMVYEYLLAQSYKLTSITFSDENENQDFEDWEDVGLNITKRPNLLQIYRNFFRKNPNEKQLYHIDTSIQTEDDDINSSKNSINEKLIEELEVLKQQIALLEQEKRDLMNNCVSTEKIECPSVDDPHHDIDNISNKVQLHTNIISTSTTPDKFEIVESLHESQDTDQDDSSSMSAILSIGDTDPTDKDWMRIKLPKIIGTVRTATATAAIDGMHENSSRHIPEKFKQNVTMHAQINIPDNLDNSMLVDTHDSLIRLFAKNLPIIVPNIIMNKRGEIIPLLLNIIRLNSDISQRDELFELLFNLKKKPQQDERQVLLGALVLAVSAADYSVEPEEILTICWEHSQHRYTEQRLLAVECCTALAPYISPDIRNSLVISMLQQMLIDDKDATVRATVIRSLALLVTLIDDPDKYFQFEELAMVALDDTSSVCDIATTILLPTLAQWALTLNRLFTNLLTRVLSKLKVSLQHTTPSKDNNNNSVRVITLINVLKILLPHTIVCIVNCKNVKAMINDETSAVVPQHFLSLSQSSLTDARIFTDDFDNIARMLNVFKVMNINENTWPELDWFNEKLLNETVEIIKLIDLSHDQVLNTFLLYLQSLADGVGNSMVKCKLKNIFETQVQELEKQITVQSGDSLQTNNLALIPGYLLILSTLDIRKFVDALKHFVIILSQCTINIVTLTSLIRLLCDQSRADIKEEILGALWSGVVHPSAIVRSTTAQLFGSIVGNVEEQLVTSRIAPAIITLANDLDLTVKAAAVTALGKLITDCTAIEVQDKARLTIETIVKEAHGLQQTLTIPLITTLANIASNCPQRYVEDIIVTQLTGITASAQQLQPRNVDLATALLNAYSTLIYCSLSDDSVTGVLLPGLKYLDTLINNILPNQKENVRLFIREAELRANGSKTNEMRSIAPNSGLSLNLPSVNVGQGVEDMRQRVSKIFTPKTSTSSMSSLFRKK